MNVKEFCNFLNISEPTIYNWRTDNPNLYKIVMEYKKEKIDNPDNLSEILKYFNKYPFVIIYKYVIRRYLLDFSFYLSHTSI